MLGLAVSASLFMLSGPCTQAPGEGPVATAIPSLEPCREPLIILFVILCSDKRPLHHFQLSAASLASTHARDHLSVIHHGRHDVHQARSRRQVAHGRG